MFLVSYRTVMAVHRRLAMSVSSRGLVFLVAGSMLATSTAAAAGQAVRPAASSIPLLAQNLGAANSSVQLPCLAPRAAVATPASTPMPSNCILAAVDTASFARAATVAASAATSAQPDQTPPPGNSSRGGFGGIGPLPIILGIITLVVVGALIIGSGDDRDFRPISPA